MESAREEIWVCRMDSSSRRTDTIPRINRPRRERSFRLTQPATDQLQVFDPITTLVAALRDGDSARLHSIVTSIFTCSTMESEWTPVPRWRRSITQGRKQTIYADGHRVGRARRAWFRVDCLCNLRTKSLREARGGMLGSKIESCGTSTTSNERMNIQGLSIHVEQHGTRTPSIIFLHYWGGTSRTWSRVASRLQDRFQTIAYDARGWGHSDKVSTGYAVKDLADEVLALVGNLKLNAFVLVGHSLGGKVAQLAASRRPEGLLGLVPVAPAPPTPLRLPEEMRETQIHAYDNRENVLQTICFLCSRMPSSEIVEQIVEDSMSGSREAALAYPTSSILEDISIDVPKIAVPTLVLAGELDQLDSIEQHKREVVARIPNAHLAIIPRSGHLIPIDEPEELARYIEEFVVSIASEPLPDSSS